MKSILVFVGQLGLVVGLAIGVFSIIEPQFYLVVGVLVAILTAGLMIAAHDDPDHSLGWFVMLFALSAAFGVFWPSLPIIAVWGGVLNRRRARASSSTDGGGPSARPGR
jgi:hypothetical protein